MNNPGERERARRLVVRYQVGREKRREEGREG